MSGHIYAIGVPGADAVKIGFAQDPGRRLASLRCGSCEDLRIIGTMPGDRGLEKQLHQRFAFAKVRGEWFRVSGEISEFVSSLTPVPSRSRRSTSRPANREVSKSETWLRLIRALLEMECVVNSATGMSRSRISRLAVSDSTFIGRVISGRSFTLRTYDRVLKWFADNWPDGAVWPADNPRPERTPAPEPAGAAS